MKFARIDIESVGFVKREDKSLVNFGDPLQNIMIKDLYKKMGINDSEIYVLNNYELTTYDGEYLILPINHVYNKNLNRYISPKIIPVFIGLNRDVFAITEEEIKYLQRHSPVGCRDEVTFNYMRDRGVKCYLNGCLTITLDKRNKEPQEEKVFVIDAPEFIDKVMPNDIKAKAVYMQNACFGTYYEITKGSTLEEITRKRYNQLKEEATLVITSRLHIASPCIAMGIPVILARDEVDYRYSWIDKYIPIYTEKDINMINWKPIAIKEIDYIKDKIYVNAVNQIKEKWNEYQQICQISDYYECRKKTQYTILNYSQKVIEFIKKKWNEDSTWEYAIWGENDASERIYSFLTKNYPNARYVAFYDSYKKMSYHGIMSQHPSEVDPDSEVFIFVAGYTATKAAKELFDSIGLQEDRYFLFDVENRIR
ncbi:MAG: hypothetical protein E7262_06025 [Lachnospiraceae bacterium]|nr:hypothetical protein [Lachnospiraceae bacterium]